MLSQVKEQMPVVETALLGHGVPSVQDDLIVTLWPTVPAVKLAWLEEGTPAENINTRKRPELTANGQLIRKSYFKNTLEEVL